MAKDGNSKDNVKKYFEVVKEGFVEIGSISKKVTGRQEFLT